MFEACSSSLRNRTLLDEKEIDPLEPLVPSCSSTLVGTNPPTPRQLAPMRFRRCPSGRTHSTALAGFSHRPIPSPAIRLVDWEGGHKPQWCTTNRYLYLGVCTKGIQLEPRAVGILADLLAASGRKQGHHRRPQRYGTRSTPLHIPGSSNYDKLAGFIDEQADIWHSWKI